MWKLGKRCVDTNANCKKVIIAGASDRLLQEVPKEYGDRIHFYSESSLDQEAGWKAFASEHVSEPVYISIDKDVLDFFCDNQLGSRFTDFIRLEQLLAVVFRQERVIGIDICGECSSTLNLFEEMRETEIDNRANGELLRFFRSFEKR